MNHNEYYYPEDDRGVSPGFQKIEVESINASTSNASDKGSLTTLHNRTHSEPASKARYKRFRHQGDPILLGFLAPNNPELVSKASRSCDCQDPCSCRLSSSSVSPTGPKPEGMAASIEVDRTPLQPIGLESYRSSPRLSLSRNRKTSELARRLESPLPTSKREANDVSDDEVTDSTRRGSRSQTRALLERQRSSQRSVPTLSSFPQTPKRPRTMESNMRSTAHREAHTPARSKSSQVLSDTLQAHMLQDAPPDNDLKLAPMASPSEPRSHPSKPIGVVLPPMRRQNLPQPRSRTTSFSSVSTYSGGSLQPHGLPQIPTLKRQAHTYPENDLTPRQPPPTLTSSASYFPAQPPSSRRIPTSHPPPFLKHKHASSTGSMISAPSLANSSTSTDGFTPSTLDTPDSVTMSSGGPQAAINDDEGGPPSLPANYIHVEHPVPGYKCTYEDCDAPPFPTPYTLSSHAKKHSPNRPYFCPQPGCKRSEHGDRGTGGQGFKRKNEMVRHGLVHDTPGYACPWCRGEGERGKVYPRPDNLLRHARDHHKDRSVEDQELRDILNKRTTPAQSRGRKKRA